MSSIDNQNMLSPVQATTAEMNTVASDEPMLFAPPNAFSYDWFVLSGDSLSTNPLTNAVMPARDMIDRGDTTLESGRSMDSMASGSSMESRVERIVQYIMPRD